MKIALVFLVCVYNGVKAQINYARQYVPQQVKYDDEGPTYHGIPYESSINKEPLPNSYENAGEATSNLQYLKAEGSPYPQPQHFHQTEAHGSVPTTYRHPGESEKASHYQLRKPSHDYPQVIYYRQPESPNIYHPQEHKPEIKEHLLSHQVEHSKPSHTSVIHPPSTVPESRQSDISQPSRTSLIYPQPARPEHPTIKYVDVPQPSHTSLVYPQPASPNQLTPKYVDVPQPSHASLVYPQPASSKEPTTKYVDVPQPSHASLLYPQPASPEQPKTKYADVPQPSHTSLPYPQPAGLEHPTPKYTDAKSTQELSTDYKQPANSQPSNSRVVRDPRLPLYFTMYEKRIIQDPVDKYGKGPWRYLTYGHGITYGSKEPGKVFERGYGYIRALGREHCKLPENNCPKINNDKPFEYEGRKEPYFGYRPH